MRDPYYEVLRTYWHRLKSWRGCIGVATVGLQIAISIAFPAHIDSPAALLPFLMGVNLIGPGMWEHFKEQIISERRFQWPNYVAPHVLVFAMLILLLVVGWPMLLILIGWPHSVGLMAFATIFMAFLGWSVLFRWSVAFFFGLACWLSLFSQSVVSYLSPFFSGQQEPIAIVILAGGLLAIVLAIRRALRLTEDKTANLRQHGVGSWSLRPRMTGEVNRSWAEAQGNRLFGWPRASKSIFIPTDSSLWSGARRWRSLTQYRSAWFLFLIAVIMPVLARLIFQDKATLPVMFVIGALLIPVISISQMWLRQWQFFEMELLRPIERGRLFKELGLGIAVNYAQLWAAFVLMILVDAVALRPQPIVWRPLLLAIAGSLALQIFSFGITTWVMRFRSLTWLFCIWVLFIPVSAITMEVDSGRMVIPGPIVVFVSISLTIVGALIASDAYERWMQTELG